MRDPREEGDLARIKALADAYASERDAFRARLAEAEARIEVVEEGWSDTADRWHEAVARAETAEADRDTLTEALEKIRDAPQPESGWRIARAALAAVEGREDA